MTRRLLALLLLVASAPAGGGPETTLVVVNALSPVSRRVANEYVMLRDIPPGHVVLLDQIPHLGVVSLDFFLESIWKPIHSHLEAAGLEDQIDLIAYSADLPYAVSFKDLDYTPKQGWQVGGVASLTGVTYLVRHVLEESAFWNLQINRYFRLDLSKAARSAPRPATAEERQLAMQAQQALARKQLAAAIEAYEKVLATYQDAPQLWYNYACCLALSGRREKSLAALEKAAEKGFRNANHARNDADLVSLRTHPRFRNLLERMQESGFAFLPAHGFRSTYVWRGEAEPGSGEDSRDRYYLSTQLAYTGPKGNSVPEILRYLRAAAGCDGTSPAGTVYICRNGNVRSTSREPFFPALTAGMKALGRKVEILEKGQENQSGVLPIGKQDVIGAVVGTAGFGWGGSKSRLLPGAIAEHLTSHGANFGTPGQTKFTEFLRHGAAGSSGTVVEPLSIHMKFPNPMIHVFYAEGCSLAEAFYQSVWGPYQLMVAGDGLARPFASFQKLEASAPPAPWRGTVAIEARGATGTFELWVDGRRVAAGAPTFRLDTGELADGHHDVRVVAISDDAVETRSYAGIAALVDNHTRRGKVELASGATVEYGDPIEIRARGAERIEVLFGARVVASSDGNVCKVASEAVGPGPVTLRPRLTLGGRPWLGEPIAVEVTAPDPIATKAEEHPYLPGLRGRVEVGEDERGVLVTHIGDRHGGARLRDRIKDARELELVGEIEVLGDGFYQLDVLGAGKVTVEVAGRTLCEGAELSRQLFLPISLAKGWHPLRILLLPKGAPHLELMLAGDQVAAAPKLRHWHHPALPREPGMKQEDGARVLTWKRSVKDVAALVLFPEKGAKSFPAEWVVETTSGSSKPKPVEDLGVLVAAGREAPIYVELSFRPVRVKKLLLRPATGDAPVSRVLVLGKRKKK